MNLNQPRPKHKRCCGQREGKRLNPFAVTVRYEDMEITLTDTNTIAEMMVRVHIWVERQIL
jgi:hypothetical protein